ncbi:hypothetical protein F3Y22_tig00110325pilonHSYRG00024 [Hibiscus syriacus]|uniref:Pentatricopeptide repeat-containing protein n=1 Tax=Hibiscus syriacus TaxID=106335 RepID=A0A6A3B0H2_HIBSY|nr:hypothetical protein F3Y22_tig00110325pilonHSYRG00024 [Hibiscus syriacus]
MLLVFWLLETVVLRRSFLNPSRFSSALKAASSKPKVDSYYAEELYSMNKKLSYLVRTGIIHEAKSMFDQMGKRKTVTWNSMISGYVKRREITQARKLFDEMPERDTVSWNLMISGCTSYLRCKFLEEGRKLFEKMPSIDVISWNTMISGYARNGRMDEAKEMFERCLKEILPLLMHFVSGLVRNGELDEAARALIECGDIFSARELFDQMVDRDTISWNTMINGYAQMDNLERARKYFEMMPQKHLVSWNTMVAGYEINKDYKGAIELFKRMQAEGEKPDRHTLSSVSVSTGLLDLQLGMQIHQLVSMSVIPDVHIKNSLITMYSRCGH